MRKFVVHTRPIPGCCQVGDAPFIVEIEGEVITAQEDTSVMWMRNGEYRFRILKPEALYEPKEIKKEDGSKAKVMVPPIYYGHFLYSTVEGARLAARQTVVNGFEYELRKTGTNYIAQQVEEKCKEIQEIML